MAKKIVGQLKLQVPAGKANPSPPIGPALGQRGINMGAPCPTIITYYQDKSFTFDIKTPPASHFLKKAAKLTSGSKAPGRESAGQVTHAQLLEIAAAKMADLNANSPEQAMKIIAGSARSMGLKVVES